MNSRCREMSTAILGPFPPEGARKSDGKTARTAKSAAAPFLLLGFPAVPKRPSGLSWPGPPCKTRLCLS